MRCVFLCLITLFVCAACTEPETTIQVQGTVAAADDGSPIAGAVVQVSKMGLTSSGWLAGVRTNDQGDYSLSFVEKGYCPESLFTISASADGFQSLVFSVWRNDPTRVRCTDEPQTIDFQLEQETT
jgi:hypothetical protein